MFQLLICFVFFHDCSGLFAFLLVGLSSFIFCLLCLRYGKSERFNSNNCMQIYSNVRWLLRGCWCEGVTYLLGVTHRSSFLSLFLSVICIYSISRAVGFFLNQTKLFAFPQNIEPLKDLFSRALLFA